MIVTLFLGTGTTWTSGEDVPLATDWTHCLKHGYKKPSPRESYITYHGHTHDDNETADEATTPSTKVLYLHIKEDMAETDRYGGAHATKRTSEIATRYGVWLVEFGEPMKWVPPNGWTDSI